MKRLPMFLVLLLPVVLASSAYPQQRKELIGCVKALRARTFFTGGSGGHLTGAIVGDKAVAFRKEKAILLPPDKYVVDPPMTDEEWAKLEKAWDVLKTAAVAKVEVRIQYVEIRDATSHDIRTIDLLPDRPCK